MQLGSIEKAGLDETELVRRGVTLDGKVSDRFGAYGTGPSVYVRDPDGYRVELKPR